MVDDVQRNTAGWRLEHTYAELPEVMYSPVSPTPVARPRLLVWNERLAASLDLDVQKGEEAAKILAGNVLPPGATPIAQAYAGHQFGHLTVLGDGRAILLGEQVSADGKRFDIQLKGSGPTPYSRSGDGRAAVGPMLREYLISEAMHALGIPTTRSLAVTATGEEVLRHRALPGAVLTRVASSHIRVGTFEWAAAQRDKAPLQALLDYTIRRHYPDAATADNPALALLEAVIDRQAALIAQWMHVGFVHGVMNTDNMALSGETIDYGPCAFMDAYDPATVFSSIDKRGRYAYGNQPAIAQWNLARFAEALLPLLHEQETRGIELATAAIEKFEDRYLQHWASGVLQKLGLFRFEEGDLELVEALFDWMKTQKADFTNTFSILSRGKQEHRALLDDDGFRSWYERWAARREKQTEPMEESTRLMQSRNPAVIPRNHKVEEALDAAENRGNMEPLEQLLEVLAAPYDYSRNHTGYTEPAAPGEGVYQTFCGT